MARWMKWDLPTPLAPMTAILMLSMAGAGCSDPHARRYETRASRRRKSHGDVGCAINGVLRSGGCDNGGGWASRAGRLLRVSRAIGSTWSRSHGRSARQLPATASAGCELFRVRKSLGAEGVDLYVCNVGEGCLAQSRRGRWPALAGAGAELAVAMRARLRRLGRGEGIVSRARRADRGDRRRAKCVCPRRRGSLRWDTGPTRWRPPAELAHG